MKLQIPYHDLGSWLDLAGQSGEVRGVEGASWQEEIGMAAELLNHSDPAPAVLFDKITGYPQGHRLLVNFFGGRRKSMTLGLPSELNNFQLSEAFTKAFQASMPIPYEFVDDGPILENIQMGDDVNVLSFPTPLWHELDGGRYIGTGCFNITQDPDEGWVNLGTYRVMVHDEKSVGFYISPGKHGRIHRDKYMARKEPMPAAIGLGGDPLLFLMSCTALPYRISAYDIAGRLRGKPYQVIKGKVTGLPIPANAEIVLEGFVDPAQRKTQGPFGELTGHNGRGSG